MMETTTTATRQTIYLAGSIADAAWCFGACGVDPGADEAARLSRLAEWATSRGVLDAPRVTLEEWRRYRALQAGRADLVPSAIADVERELNVPPWTAAPAAAVARENARWCLANARSFAASATWHTATAWAHEALAHVDAALCAAMDDGGASARASAAWAAKLAARYDGADAAARASAAWREAVAAKSDAERAMYARARVITDPIRAKLLPSRGFAD